MDVHFSVAGERQVGLRFEHFPDALHDELKGVIDALGAELLARVQGATPSRTGKLRNEVRLRLYDDKTRITARVDIAAPKGSAEFGKAAALEYGAHHATKVAAHKMRLDHAWAQRLEAPIHVLVAAHSRTPNIDEHRFERGPLEEMQPEVLERLNAVVGQAVAQANA